MGLVLAKSLPSDARVISKPTCYPDQTKTSKTVHGVSEKYKTKADKPRKPSEMIPD